MEPLTKGFPGKLQPRRINLLKRGNYMKGSKGWMLNPLTWIQQTQMTPSSRYNQHITNMLPTVFPTLWERAESPLLRAPHFLDFPSE